MKKFHLKPTIFCSKIPKNIRKTDCYNNNIEKIEESNGNGLKKTIGICCAKCIFYKLKNNASAIMTARKGKNIHEENLHKMYCSRFDSVDGHYSRNPGIRCSAANHCRNRAGGTAFVGRNSCSRITSS